MARRKRYSQSAELAIPRTAGHAARHASSKPWWNGFGRSHTRNEQMKAHELTFILRTLATLVDNGVSLPKSLATLAKEETLAKHREVLEAIRNQVESGIPFSAALAEYPHICNKLMIHQIHVGEQSGALADTLKQLASNRDKSSELKRAILKKLAYPAMLVIMGSLLITFLLIYVIPVFQETYDNAHVPLPFITQVLIVTGDIVRKYGWIVIVVGTITVLAIRRIREHDRPATAMDRALLKIPLFGNVLRDIAVLQLMEVLRNLLKSGFTLADALGQIADSVGNRAVRQGVGELKLAVLRGERFSHELERHAGIFPPIVSQLVLVGESTGRLEQAIEDICEHLRRGIEQKTTLLVGSLEPLLTITMAAAVAVILLAIYLPMFDMVNTIS